MSATSTSAPSSGLVLKNRESFGAIGSVAKEAIAILEDQAGDQFDKAYVAACAMSQIQIALTDDVMRPIMALQGSPIGFKTDRDDKGGYDIATVRNALITAVLSGLRPTGNEFNIIGGNCYAALNGCERLFNSICEVPPRHEPGLVKIDEASKRATVVYKITFKIKGQPEKTRELEIATKLAYSRNTGALLTTDDQVLGKARRKMLHSLLRELRGLDIEMAPEPEMRNVTPPKPIKDEPNALPSSSEPVVEAAAFSLEGAQ